MTLDLTNTFILIAYLFNGRNEKIKAQTSRLTLLADKPGNLTIVSVGDQRNKCRSFPKGMTKVIHEIPSSLVSGGKEIIENIQEGKKKENGKKKNQINLISMNVNFS